MTRWRRLGWKRFRLAFSYQTRSAVLCVDGPTTTPSSPLTSTSSITLVRRKNCFCMGTSRTAGFLTWFLAALARALSVVGWSPLRSQVRFIQVLKKKKENIKKKSGILNRAASPPTTLPPSPPLPWITSSGFSWTTSRHNQSLLSWREEEKRPTKPSSVVVSDSQQVNAARQTDRQSVKAVAWWRCNNGLLGQRTAQFCVAATSFTNTLQEVFEVEMLNSTWE